MKLVDLIHFETALYLEISDSRKISTASLISSVPTSVISLPPNHGLPTPAGALGVNVATTHVIPTSAINVPISTPSGQQYFNALAPPSHPPPVAPSSQLIHPQTHLIHHRSTLPSRLTNQVSDEPEVMVGNGRVMTTEEENYASIVQARHERRAATIAGDMNLYGPPDHVHQAERASLNLEVAEGSYKSLNQYLMDDQQVYEHPSRMLGSIDDDDDDHVVEAYNEEEEVVEAYKEEEEARYQVRNDGGVKFYDDSDDDSIYMQTIVRNTGNVKTNTSDTADTSDTTNTSDTSLAKVSKAKTTTKSTDKGAGLLLRDIPLPPQCPIPIPPNCKLSPPTGSARLPGLHLLPSSRSPSPMPPTVSGLGGGVACGEAPPPPSIHLIPTRSPSPKPPAITTSPPAESASSSSSNSSISSSSSGSSSNEASNPTARVQLLPPQATGPTNPRTGGIEIPPPRLLNPNTYSQLRPKLQSPIAHPLISQKLTSLVPVSRVSMDGEYVVPNEALEQEGDLLSQQDRVRDDDGEEGELPDYIDIS